jgi:hypothetical protein
MQTTFKRRELRTARINQLRKKKQDDVGEPATTGEKGSEGMEVEEGEKDIETGMEVEEDVGKAGSEEADV